MYFNLGIGLGGPSTECPMLGNLLRMAERYVLITGATRVAFLNKSPHNKSPSADSCIEASSLI